MPRKAKIDNFYFVKCPDDADHSLRDKIYQMAYSGEKVIELINRAYAAGLGTKRQIRAALNLGQSAKGSKFKIVEKI